MKTKQRIARWRRAQKPRSKTAKKKKPKIDLEQLFIDALLRLFPDLPKPVRQHVFHPYRKWRFDFAWTDYKIAVEIQGGSYMRRGGHNTAVGQALDFEKQREAVRLGWRLFPFNRHELHEKPNKKKRKTCIYDCVLFLGEFIEKEMEP